MNKNVKSVSLSTALLLSPGWMTVAHATVLSDVTTQTAEIIFAATGTATISLTAKSGLIAGSYSQGQSIATGTATASAGSVSYRWTPGTGTVSDTGDGVDSLITVKGTDDTSHTVTLNLISSGTGTEGGMIDGGSGWIVPKTQGTKNISLDVQNYTTAIIQPDTYILSIDAAVWGY